MGCDVFYTFLFLADIKTQGRHLHLKLVLSPEGSATSIKAASQACTATCLPRPTVHNFRWAGWIQAATVSVYVLPVCQIQDPLVATPDVKDDEHLRAAVSSKIG